MPTLDSFSNWGGLGKQRLILLSLADRLHKMSEVGQLEIGKSASAWKAEAENHQRSDFLGELVKIIR